MRSERAGRKHPPERGNVWTFVPILVTFDEYFQVAFETDRSVQGTVAIYLPGAPNPWSGNVVFVAANRVKNLSVSVTEAL